MIECVICGRKIEKQSYAIRDYTTETYWQWMWRHIKSIFSTRLRQRNDGKLAVCSQCAWRYTNEQENWL